MADKRTQKRRRRPNGKVIFRKVVGGEIFKESKTINLLPLVLFASLLALIFIANSYYAQKTNKKIYNTQKELKEKRFEYISVRSELMQQTRPSDVARGLVNRGVKESNVPPYKLKKVQHGSK